MIWIIVVGIIVVLVIALIFIYNSLVRANVRVNEAWSDITVQLKRRADLIPNLVETVKGYAKHEKTLLEDVTKTRSASVNAESPKEAAQAENMFQQTMKSLFAVAENYPDLKADKNYRHLQEELVDTEDKIQAARRFYNGSVRDLNSKIQVLPTKIFAGMFGFNIREFFEVGEAEGGKIAQPTKVAF